VTAAPHSRLPRLDLGIDWVPRWEEFRTSLRDALSGPKPDGNEAVSGGDDLRVEWVRGYRPRSPFLVAMLGHATAIWLITLPIWGFLPQTQAAAPMQIEMSWDVSDLPAISLPARAEKKPVAKPQVTVANEQTEAQRGADAFNPRQTILSVPVKLTHPRQTLIQPDAPAKAPTIVEQMPNIVQWSAPQLQRPQIQYSTSESKPELRQVRQRAVAAPQIAENAKNTEMLDIAQPKDLKLAPPAPIPSAAVIMQRHATRHEAMAAPQVTESTKGALVNVAETMDVNLAPPAPVPSNSAVAARHRAAPQVGAAPEVANGNSADTRKLIALSADPAPPRPEVSVPKGNLAANVAVSPDSAKAGAPNGSGHDTAGAKAANTNGDSMAAISISGPAAKPSSTSGGPIQTGNITPHLNLSMRPTAQSESAAAHAVQTGPANVAALAPGAPPEQLLSGKIFSMHVSTPNTTSTRGSWAVSFSQLGADPRPTTKPDDTLSGPEPIYTVDPKYPQETMTEHISGEVVLYAIIRKDGSVDSVQLVRGLDPRLDKAAIEAFTQWKFRPGSRAGVPVDIEAVIHVPFEYRQLNY
jgi:protein TonB